jgi:quinol monooxygenase YgiN
MSQPLTIVARIEAKTDQIDLVKQELIKLIQPTLAEAGCLQYDLHQDHDNPAVFLFFENWESRPLWQDHMNSEHLKAFKAAAEAALEGLVVHEMSKID